MINNKQQRYIALTGCRYSGKKTVCKILKHLGIAVFDADEVLKYYLSDKKYNISMYTSNERLYYVIKNIIPKIIKNYVDWHRKMKVKYSVFKFSLIFEFKIQKFFYKVISMNISDDEQRNNGANTYILNNQLLKTFYKLESDFIINNDKRSNLSNQIFKILKDIKNETNFTNNWEVVV